MEERGEQRRDRGEEITEWEEEGRLGQKDSSLMSSWVTDSIDLMEDPNS